MPAVAGMRDGGAARNHAKEPHRSAGTASVFCHRTVCLLPYLGAALHLVAGRCFLCY